MAAANGRPLNGSVPDEQAFSLEVETYTPSAGHTPQKGAPPPSGAQQAGGLRRRKRRVQELDAFSEQDKVQPSPPPHAAPCCSPAVHTGVSRTLWHGAWGRLDPVLPWCCALSTCRRSADLKVSIRPGGRPCCSTAWQFAPGEPRCWLANGLPGCTLRSAWCHAS